MHTCSEIEWNRVLYWSQLKGSSALTIKKRQANRNSSDLLPLSPTPPLPRSSSLALHRLHGDVRLAHRLHLDPVWCLRGAQWVATLPSSPSNPPPPSQYWCWSKWVFFFSSVSREGGGSRPGRLLPERLHLLQVRASACPCAPSTLHTAHLCTDSSPPPSDDLRSTLTYKFGRTEDLWG